MDDITEINQFIRVFFNWSSDNYSFCNQTSRKCYNLLIFHLCDRDKLKQSLLGIHRYPHVPERVLPAVHITIGFVRVKVRRKVHHR